MGKVIIKSDRDKFQMEVAFRCPVRAANFARGFTRTVQGMRSDEGVFTEDGLVSDKGSSEYLQRGAAFVTKFCNYLDREGILFKKPIAEVIG